MFKTHLTNFSASKEAVGEYANVLSFESHLGLMAQAVAFVDLDSRRYTAKEAKILGKENHKQLHKTLLIIERFMKGLPEEQKHYDEKAKRTLTYLNLWSIHGVPAFAGLFATLSLISDPKVLAPVSPANKNVKIPFRRAKKYIDGDNDLLEKLSQKKKVKLMDPLMLRLSYSEKKHEAELYFFHALHENTNLGMKIEMSNTSYLSEENYEKNSLKINDDKFYKLMPHIIPELISHSLYAIGACTDYLTERIWLNEEAEACLPGANLSGTEGYPKLRASSKIPSIKYYW